MRCIASSVRGGPIHAGIYFPVVSIDGCAPNRNAIIVDCWGASQYVREHEDGRWQLANENDGAIAQFVPN